MDRLTDDLVRRASAGAAAALSEVYEILAPRVRGYLLARGSEDPDGLTNEVFIQVLQKMGTVTGGATGLRTFVFSVAHARLVDETRARARRPDTVSYDPVTDARRHPSPEETVLSGVDGRLPEHLSVSLDRLTEEQRSVLLLRVVADLSVEETASTLDRTVGSVKQLHRRALLSLRSIADAGEVAR